MGLGHLRQISLTKKVVGTFLEPLQAHADKNDRVHCSYNLGTATGRLCCSCPNLQQLPAMDVYEVRRGIACGPDRMFVIADYGQLDLRVLAHLTESKAMCKALNDGIDLHTATAMNMFEDIRDAVARGDVLLNEVEGSEVPLLKDVYASQRKKAKTVNFGIAYGLTPTGLSGQLGCDINEAEDMINRWHNAYPEVREWLDRQVKFAETADEPHVETLSGRWRRIEGLKRKTTQGGGKWALRAKWQASYKVRRQYESDKRQACNAPVQGGSADVVVEAMLKAHRNEELKKLGYEMLLQVHDELIFEGPAESAVEALRVVKDIMEHPFLDGHSLIVPLPVDAKMARTWLEGKAGGMPVPPATIAASAAPEEPVATASANEAPPYKAGKEARDAKSVETAKADKASCLSADDHEEIEEDMTRENGRRLATGRPRGAALTAAAC